MAKLLIFLSGVAMGAAAMYWFYALRQICEIQDDYENWIRLVEERHNDEIHLRDSA